MHSNVKKTSIDWSIQNRIPPWLSNIESGSSQGVAIVLGQSLKPDGNPSQVLLDRALKAKELLETQKVSKVIVTGGDPAGVGRTEAYEMKQVLVKAGIPAEARHEKKIIKGLRLFWGTRQKGTFLLSFCLICDLW